MPRQVLLGELAAAVGAGRLLLQVLSASTKKATSKALPRCHAARGAAVDDLGQSWQVLTDGPWRWRDAPHALPHGRLRCGPARTT